MTELGAFLFAVGHDVVMLDLTWRMTREWVRRRLGR